MKIYHLVIAFLLIGNLALADPMVREIQRELNALQLDAGPVDGAWGNRTERALIEFLEHRGIAFDGEFGESEYLEVIGQRGFTLPSSSGLRLCSLNKFPSRDTFATSEDDDTEFTVTLKAGDYDPADYSSAEHRHDPFSTGGNMNMNKQRAELFSCNRVSYGKTYTLDFEIKVSHASAGTIFQIHAGGPQGSASLQAFPDSMRWNAGREINNVAVYRGDWLGRWVPVRIVFRADRADRSFFRFYVDGVETLDTAGSVTDFGFSNRGARLKFGMYRGNSSITASASYRRISLSTGDLGGL